jgi:hypothetical protein
MGFQHNERSKKMSNGKFALAAATITEERKSKPRHKHKINKKEPLKSPRIDMIGNAAARFFTIPFAIFVGFLEFFSCGFEAALRKALALCEGAKDDNAIF